MLVDANEVPAAATRRYDLCIVGAGAAGIAIAHRLRAHPARVCLLESGGLRFDARTQALYEGTSTARGFMGARYLTHSRLRFFGGSTNHWTSWCAPLDREDFARRPWLAGSGWPLSREDLDPWYREAQAFCGLGPFDYDLERWRGAGAAAPPFGADAFGLRMWQRNLAPLRFGAAYGPALREAPRVDVTLHANALRLVLDRDGGRLARVEVATLRGRRFAVEARLFVLACGGLENARLLLHSRGPAPRGIGNQHDLVGRYYLDHAHPRSVGTALLADEASRRALELVESPLAAAHPGLVAVSTWVPHAAKRESQGLLSGSYGVNDEAPEPISQDEEDLRRAVESGGGRAGLRANLIAVLEQSPNPESRVTLDPERRDELGLPRLRLDWRFNDLDRASLLRSLEILAGALGASGRGRLGTAAWLRRADPWPGRTVLGGSHHLGTTRMSASPRSGVVDPTCRVHGVHNLYVAGSSVFPTSGRVNPTLTLVALARRLADHLGRELAPPVS